MKTTRRHSIITALAAVVLTTSCWTEHGINRPSYEPETYVPPYKVYGNTMEALGNNSIVIVEDDALRCLCARGSHGKHI